MIKKRIFFIEARRNFKLCLFFKINHMQEGSMGREINGFNKKPRKHRVVAETDPGIVEAQAQLDTAKSVDFSDKEVTKVYKRSKSLDRDVAGVMEGLDKASAMIENEKIEKGINRALDQEEKAEEEEVADVKEMGESTLKQLAKEKKRKLDLKKSIEEKVGEDEEVADIKRIREAVAGSGVKKSSSSAKGREFEGSKTLLPQILAEKAQAAYAQAFTKYDSKLTAKLSYDMIAATRPPRLAFLTAKGRELNRLYKDMQEKIRAAGQGEDEE